MNILVVGAGAVGQVYGHHLHLGGARVAFFVRPKAAAACREGMTLYRLRRRGERTPVTLHADAVHTNLAEVAKERWDQVWLCVPANALDEAWLASIAAAVGDALIVALPPGMDSEARIRRAFPGDRVVPALIGMMSYQAPLPGETVTRPGIAYHFPIGNPSTFGGARGAEAAKVLTQGGCPAVAKRDVARTNAFGSAILMPNVAALELAGWSLATLRSGGRLALAARASREAIRVAAACLGVRAPLFVHLLRGVTLWVVWAVAPRAVPFELEAFFRCHLGAGPALRA